SFDSRSAVQSSVESRSPASALSRIGWTALFTCPILPKISDSGLQPQTFSEILIRMAKSIEFKTILDNSPETSGWHFLVIEKRIADKLSFKDRYKRVVCTIKGGEPFQCALLPSGGRFYIIVNKKKREALGI